MSYETLGDLTAGFIAEGGCVRPWPETLQTKGNDDLIPLPLIPVPVALFDQNVGALFDQAENILIQKHHDYGPNNIALSPGGALNGLRVRMHDKLARLNNLIDAGKQAKYESLEDTLVDLANYALIGVLVLRKQWPNAD